MHGSSYKVLYWLLVSCLPNGHTETSVGSNYCMLPLNVSFSLLLPWSSVSNFLLLIWGEWLSLNSIFSVLSRRLKNGFSHRLICPDSFSVLVSTVFPLLSALGFSWKKKKISFSHPFPLISLLPRTQLVPGVLSSFSRWLELPFLLYNVLLTLVSLRMLFTVWAPGSFPVISLDPC